MSERKRAKLDEEAVAAADQRQLEQLRALQKDLDKVSEQLHEKVLALEQEYAVRRAPLYDKRSEVLRKIPGFWRTTLSQHPAFSVLMTEEDADVLNHLTDLVVAENADVRTGYKVTLRFKDNPFFTNKELTKALTIGSNGALSSTCTEVQWKATEEAKAFKAAREARITDEEEEEDEPRATFFDWFTEAVDFGTNDSDEFADCIKQEIWPDPLQFFFGDEAADGDEDEDEDEGATPDEEDL